MERKRIDLAGTAKPASSSRDRGAGAGSDPADKRKNAILLGVAGVSLLTASYFIYANFIATPKAPPEAADPIVESVFDNAAKAPPPPPEDTTKTYEQGGGKRLGPS